MRRILTIGRRCLSATGPAARPVARRSTRVRGTPTPMMSAIERGSGLQTTPIARGQPSKTNGCANAMRRILNIEKRFWSATAPFAGRIATRSTPRRGRPMPATTGIGRESGLPATSGTARRSGWHRSMGCRSRITTPCSPARAAPAPSASKRRPAAAVRRSLPRDRQGARAALSWMQCRARFHARRPYADQRRHRVSAQVEAPRRNEIGAHRRPDAESAVSSGPGRRMAKSLRPRSAAVPRSGAVSTGPAEDARELRMIAALSRRGERCHPVTGLDDAPRGSVLPGTVQQLRIVQAQPPPYRARERGVRSTVGCRILMIFTSIHTTINNDSGDPAL